MEQFIEIPTKSLKRLAHYRYYLNRLEREKREYVSNERLARDLNITTAEVREDMENLNPALGVSEIHQVGLLVKIVEEYLGYSKKNSAVLAGVGNLGSALAGYEGFGSYGLEIVALFDNDPALAGKTVHGISVMDAGLMADMIERLKVKIGIITTPPDVAQQVADVMVEAGVSGIWNFTLAVLKVPEHISLQNSSLHNDFLNLTQQIEREHEHKKM